MNLTAEDIKSTLIRLQGQFDVWQNLLQAVQQEEVKKAEAKHADATESK